MRRIKQRSWREIDFVVFFISEAPEETTGAHFSQKTDVKFGINTKTLKKSLTRQDQVHNFLNH